MAPAKRQGPDAPELRPGTPEAPPGGAAPGPVPELASRPPGPGRRRGRGAAPGGPDQGRDSDLAAWLGIFHSSYVKFVVGLGLIGLLMAATAFMDLQLLEILIVTLFGRPAAAGEGSGLMYAITTIANTLNVSGPVVILFLYGLVLGFRAFLMYMNKQVVGRLELASMNDLEREVLRNLLRKDSRFIKEKSVSVVTSRLSKDGDAITQRRQFLAEIWVNFVTVFGYFLFFLTRNGFTDEHILDPNSVKLTLLGFVSVALGVALTNYIGRGIRFARERMLGADDNVKSALEDNLATAAEVQVGNLHNRVINDFSQVQERRRRPFLDLVRYGSTMSVNYNLTYLISFVVFVFAAIRINQGADETVTTYVTLILRILPDVFRSLTEIATDVMQMDIARPSVTRLLEYASPAIDVSEPDEEAPPVGDAPITLKGVNYRYGPRDQVRGGDKGINATIKPHTLNVIVGSIGSGKSMLSRLILGQLEVTAGSMTFGDSPLQTLSSGERSRIFAYMPQEPALLDRSIEENLVYAMKKRPPPGAGFTDDQMRLLSESGIGHVALEKALEMFPDTAMARGYQGPNLPALRQSLQETVADRLGVEIIPYGPTRADPNHPLVDHLVGGATEQGRVLGLSRSSTAKGVFDALTRSEFGAALVSQALEAIGSTKELLSKFQSVEEYNEVAPFALEPEVWQMRQRLMNLPEEAAGGSARLPLLALGLLASPNEIRDGWSPADPLPVARRRPDGSTSVVEPDEKFVSELKGLLAGAIEPFDMSAINTNLTWRDNLLFGAPTKFNVTQRDAIDELILAKIRETDLAGVLTRSGFTYRVGRGGGRLSGGQKQRVSLGRTLLRDVRVYILDEPTSAQDPRGRARLNRFFKEHATRNTIIAIAHDRDLAMIADQVLMMKNGALVAAGTYDELMGRSRAFKDLFGQEY